MKLTYILIGISVIAAVVNPAAAGLASRTSGVAPLYVFFNAVDPANGVVQPPADGNGHVEYADFNYQWDFGDIGAGKWCTTGLPKNSAEGYVAAHVYETPGTYTATLKVTKPDGTQSSYTTQITVTDPDVVYAGEKTTCVSTGNDFSGCPVGAAQVTTSVFSDFQKYLGNGRRLLLRRGDSWTGNTTINLKTNGPMTLGAFGACDSADRFGNCSNAPLITVHINAGDNPLFCTDNTMDIRIMDLRLAPGVATSATIGGVTEMHQDLFLRLKWKGMSAFGNSYYETHDFNGLSVVNCDFSESAVDVVYLGGTHLAVLGNSFKNTADSHVIRIWQAYRGVIAHNEISGSSLQKATDGRHALKVHSPPEADIAAGKLKYRTQYVIVKNNVFGGSGPWPVAIGPEDATAENEEHLSDVVFERNKVITDFGNQGPNDVQVGLCVWTRYATIRNNVFDGTGTGKYYTAILIDRRGPAPAPVGCRVLNNTIYRMSTPGEYMEYTGIEISANDTGTVIKNNLVQFPSASGAVKTLIVDPGSKNTVKDHNVMTSNAGLIDPGNTNPLLRNYGLAAGSLAIGTGTPTLGLNDTMYPVTPTSTPLPVFEDFKGNPRTPPYDLGAFQFGSSSISFPITSVGLNRPPLRLKNAYVYPNPAIGTDPTIRAKLGIVERMEITIFDRNGKVVHNAAVDGDLTTVVNGDYTYDYRWTGKKASGIYYAVIHGKKGSQTVCTRAGFAVLR